MEVEIGYWCQGPGSLDALKKLGGQVYPRMSEEINLKEASYDSRVILYLEKSGDFIQNVYKSSLLGRFIVSYWNKIELENGVQG